jgi:error-prone DNA polymerase
MTAGREVVEDYRSTGLSLRRHPVSFLRADLRAQHITRCADLANARDGQRLTVAGIVLVRQRPGSARGVLFITIEDETGHANLIVWPSVFDRQRRLVLTASMLACRGKVQREGEVIHVVADHLTDLSPLLRSVGQRDENFPAPFTSADHFKHPAGPDPRETKAIKVATRDFR